MSTRLIVLFTTCGLAGAASATGLGPTLTEVNDFIGVHSAATPFGESPAAVQGPLQLYYQTTDLFNGTWLYNFTLVNTNIDGSWAPGQNFDWIVFGDQANNTPSNLLNWVGDVSSLVGSPWADEGFSTSGGGHNGPTLLDFNNGLLGWVPANIGDSVSWSGTSTVDLQEPDLLWSNLVGSGVHADFLPAIRIPAPSAAALIGLAGLVAGRRRR
jgi:hypothetical protein